VGFEPANLTPACLWNPPSDTIDVARAGHQLTECAPIPTEFVTELRPAADTA
jgi:hypothetical protein